jgi:hypothetical protein
MTKVLTIEVAPADAAQLVEPMKSPFWYSAADASVGAAGGRVGGGPNKKMCSSSCSSSCKMVVARSRAVLVQSVEDNAIAVLSKESVSWQPNDFVPAGIVVKKKVLVMGHVETIARGGRSGAADRPPKPLHNALPKRKWSRTATTARGVAKAQSGGKIPRWEPL